MARIKVINKRGSRACRTIREKAKIYMYKGKNKWTVDALVNYGVCGNKLDKFYKLYPSAKKIPVINRNVGLSKLGVINLVEEQGIIVPKSKLSLSVKDNRKDFIEKRKKSIGGIGICRARGKRKIAGKYYQEFIDDRSYELRVHAFEWMKKFHVQKRHGSPDKIAWNYNNGGHFSTVRNIDMPVFKKAIETSRKVLSVLGMGFGAVDFLVDSSRNLYFIEINSAPGFQELSEHIYVDAFKALKEMPTRDLRKLKCLS